MRYSVIVGNVGNVLHTYDLAEAYKTYNEYVAISKDGVGRAGGEQVSLCEDGEPLQEYFPDNPEFSDQLPPSGPSWQEVLKETDWAELRKQKEVLIATISSIKPGVISDPLEGILNFLDSVQDAAAEEIGEDKVFDHHDTEDQESDPLAGNDEGLPIFAVTVINNETMAFHVPAKDEDDARKIVESMEYDELMNDPGIKHESINTEYGIEEISPNEWEDN